MKPFMAVIGANIQPISCGIMAIRTVILAGELAKKYGRKHRLDVCSPAEAIRAFCANFSDFKEFMMTSEQRGVGYRCIVDGEDMRNIDDIQNPFSRTFRIVPVIGGAKSALFGILIGAALITAAVLTGGAGSAAVFAFAGGETISTIAMGIGASLVLGGVSQMLSRTPKSQSSEQTENKPSYVFNGPVNTITQGQCVPVCYGRVIVGSAVISAGSTASEYNG